MGGHYFTFEDETMLEMLAEAKPESSAEVISGLEATLGFPLDAIPVWQGYRYTERRSGSCTGQK